jgi:PAS domain S-box-containing protein
MSSNSNAQNLFSSLVLESLQDGIVVVDETQSIRYCNAGVESIFGYSRAELLGSPIANLMPLRFRLRYVDRVQSFQDGAGLLCDLSDRPSLTGQRANGVEFPLSVNLAKLEWQGQSWVACVVRDMSAHSASSVMAGLRREHEQLTSQANTLIEEIKLLRGKDERTEGRIHQLEDRVSELACRSSDKASVQDWFGHFSLWQKIIAALAAGVLMLSQGASLSNVLDQVLTELSQIELSD